jgi:hypothetical protein
VKLILLAAIQLLFSSFANAQTTCGNCIPPELEESARTFEMSIEREDHPVLRRRQLLGTLCVEYDCGENPSLSEEQVSKLVDLHIVEEDMRLAFRAASTIRSADQRVAWVGAIGALIAALAALGTLIYSIFTRKIAVDAKNTAEEVSATFKTRRSGVEP